MRVWILRIGFDLGASDRKAAAVIDGEVVFSDEVAWDPSKQSDPIYHFEGINDSLKKAAAHLPKVDAIGGSAAGLPCQQKFGGSGAHVVQCQPYPTSQQQ